MSKTRQALDEMVDWHTPPTTFKVVKRHPDAKMPQRSHPHDAGWDVFTVDGPYMLRPGARKNFSLGLAFDIPKGWEIQMRPRSGLALKQGITVLNSPGTIDAGYTGTNTVVLINHGDDPVDIVPGMKIAQLVFARVADVVLEEGTEEDLGPSDRGAGGFGSTGV